MGTTRENIVVKFITKGSKRYQKDMKGMADNSEELTQNLRKVNTVAGRMGRRFAIARRMMRNFRMEFLGIMFGGMLIQRTFQMLAKTTTDTFMKISQGATPAGQAITALSAEMTFLRFTIGRVIGEALLPMLPKLIELIDNVRNWISENPKLTTGLIVAGIAFGFLLFVVGSLALLVNSLSILFGPKGLLGAMRLVSKVGVISALKTSAAWVVSAVSTAAAWIAANIVILGLWALLVIGIVALILIIALYWKELWLGIRMLAAMAWNGILDIVERGVNNWLKLMRPIFEAMKAIGLISDIPRLNLGGYKQDMSQFDEELLAIANAPSAKERLGSLREGITNMFNFEEVNVGEGATPEDASAFIEGIMDEVEQRSGG